MLIVCLNLKNNIWFHLIRFNVKVNFIKNLFFIVYLDLTLVGEVEKRNNIDSHIKNSRVSNRYKVENHTKQY